jgi:hypothetical protein
MKDNRAVISRLNTSYAILFLIMVAPVLALAQGGDTVFTVKQAKASVSISPKVDALYKNVSKKFVLTKPEGTVIDTIVFSEGSTMRKDSLFLIKPSKTGTGMLKIYGHAGGGKRQLLLVKEFAVNTFAEPKPNLDGVDSDSAIHRMKAVAQGYVNVPMNNDPALKRLSHKVLSFEMQSTGNGRMDTLKATGNRMTYEMRDRVDKMQDGNLIQISNIRYLINEDTFVIRQPLRISLLNDKINKF